MNDQQNPYDPYELVGYDEYGQPVYQYAQQQTYGYDPYAQQQQSQQQAAPYDPYAQQQPQQHQQQYGQQAQQQQQAYGYGYDTGTGQQPAAVDTTAPYDPYAQQARPQQSPQPVQVAPETPVQEPVVPGQRRAERTDQPEGQARDGDAEYRTEQFSFIEEPDEDSEDVIDWLKFTESRSERREEAKRRTHNRIVALVVVAVLAVVGGVGYLWFAGELPGLSDEKGKGGAAAAGPQHRDVIVLHLHTTGKKADTSTVLLVDNTTTKRGTTVLLPDALAVADDDGSTTTLANSVEQDGSTGTRESLATLLGAKITGTWRLDTPYLENLVEQVGGIDIDTDTAVPGAKKGDAPLVAKGQAQTLNGQAAVAYSTYRGPGEPEAEQLQRFGQVVQAVLRKLPDDDKGATVVVQTLAQVLDPSLPEQDLGAFLAKLAGRAKGGDYKTVLLPAQPDGTLSEQTADGVVKDVLGGSVKAPEQGGAVRVGVRNATGDKSATEAARAALFNGGYTVIDGGGASGDVEVSQVTYGDAAQKPKAVEVAKTLGLKESAVKQGKVAANADVTVVLGRDYEAK